MSDFDLSLVVRAEDQGALATANGLAQGIDKISAAQDRSSAASDSSAQASGRAAAAIGATANGARTGTAAFDAYGNSQKKTGSTSEDVSRRQKAVADAINQVVRATNPAISSQKLLDAALGRVLAGYIQGKYGAETYARAQEIASRATFQSADALGVHARQSGNSRLGQMELMHVVRASTDSFAAGTPLLQIFTMELSRIGEAISFYAMSAQSAAGPTGQATAAIARNTAAAEENAVANEAAAVAAGTLGGAVEVEAAAEVTNATAKRANAAASEVEAIATGAAAVAMDADTVATEANAVAHDGAAASAGGFARFLGGPWSIAVIAAISVIAALASHMGEADDATAKMAGTLKTLATSADNVTVAQGMLAPAIDLVTGKWESQNMVLRETIRLQAIIAAQQAHKDNVAAAKKLNATIGTIEAAPGEGFASITPGGTGLGQMPEDPRTRAARESYAKLVENFRTNRSASVVEFRKSLETLRASGGLKGLNVEEALQQALTIASGRQTIDTMNDVRAVAEGRVPLPDYLQKDPPKHRTRHPRQKKTPDLTVMGLNMDEQIKRIESGFTDTPPQVEKVRHSLAELDKIMVELAKKKPPNFEALIAQAKEAKDVVINGLNKPYNDFILKQNDALAVQQLLTQGRTDEADALKIVLDLERQQGPLSQAQKDGVLATVQALRAQQREQEILHEQQQKYLTAVGQVKSALMDAVADPAKGIVDLPKKLIGAFTQLKAAKIFDNLFGNTFREIEDKITGANVAKDAAARMADAVDHVAQQTDRTTSALDTLATAANNAAGAVGGTANTLNEPGSRLADLHSVVGGLQAGGGSGGTTAAAAGIMSTLAGLAHGKPVVNYAKQDGDGIVVTGSKSTAANFSGWIEKLSKGVGISDKAASTIGSFAGKGIEGAATGALTNSFLQPLGKALGFRTSQAGAEIGGAIGSFIPIPGGQIIGSIAGSLIGGLLSKPKPKSGGAVISNAYDAASATGNNADMQKVAGSAASDVQGAILNIAQQLGGTAGSFKISIGEQDGKWSVDPLGLNRSAKSGRGGVAFGEDQGAATNYAVQAALSQGAVQGLSKAVAAALQSSPDVNKALQEAINVKNLETLIGGVGGAIKAQFQTFDAMATERVRLAKKYGLDLLAVEKINGEQRVALVDQILQQRIGSLLDFQKELTYGDLFEGDAFTRRSSIMSEINKTIPDAEAGKDGAAGSLSDLYKQLVTTSRDAFGTAGPEYASDRQAAQDEISRVIQIENDRIAQASAQQQATADALKTNNTLTDETNTLIAGVNSRLDSLIGAVMAATGGGTALAGLGVSRFTEVRA